MNSPKPIPDERIQLSSSAVAHHTSSKGRALPAVMPPPVQRFILPEKANVAKPVIQRKIGFEFEDGRWRAWKKGYFSRIYPAERKAVLHKGKDFNLEGDDSPGPTATNLEFVTEAFEESPTGQNALNTTLKEIKDVVHFQLDPNVGKPGPEDADGPLPYTYKAGNFVEQAQHHLTGPAYGNGQWLYLSKGKAGGSFKMQVTSGLPLSDLPPVMKTFGIPVGKGRDNARQHVNRAPARKALSGADNGGNIQDILKVIGTAPALATKTLKKMQRDNRLTVKEKTALGSNETDIIGFLSAVMMTMKMLQLPIDGVVKYRIPLMFRTDFAHLFAALPPMQKAVLKAHPDVLAESLVNSSNEKPLLPRTSGVDPDTGLTTGDALIRPPRRPSYAATTPMPHEALSGITIQVWINNMVKGTDLLTPAGANEWLKTQGWWWYQRKDKVDLLESFGSIGQTDKSDPGRGELGVFENRTIAPKGGSGDLNIDEAAKLAWNQFLFYKKMRDIHGQGVGPGKYPDETPDLA